MSQTHASCSFLICLSQLNSAAPKLKQCVRDHGLVEKYDALATMVSIDIERLDEDGELVHENILAHMILEIHRELTWANCNLHSWDAWQAKAHRQNQGFSVCVAH
ncbi:MAG: hypothetical protein BYD32DRAFT_437421 [Podila humilis]|nr:MAG: hypothetical protein BYD32DRAFT_437421 [Podila humilis]